MPCRRHLAGAVATRRGRRHPRGALLETTTVMTGSEVSLQKAGSIASQVLCPTILICAVPVAAATKSAVEVAWAFAIRLLVLAAGQLEDRAVSAGGVPARRRAGYTEGVLQPHFDEVASLNGHRFAGVSLGQDDLPEVTCRTTAWLAIGR